MSAKHLASEMERAAAALHGAAELETIRLAMEGHEVRVPHRGPNNVGLYATAQYRVETLHLALQEAWVFMCDQSAKSVPEHLAELITNALVECDPGS